MGKYYQPKKKSGCEYLLAAKDFHHYTLHSVSKLPVEWKSFYLDPLVEKSRYIANQCELANSVYMKQSSPELLVKAYSDRINYLMNAERMFDPFDSDFDSLMSKLDLFSSERARLRNILCQILRKNGFAVSVNGRDPVYDTNFQPDITVNVSGYINDVAYTSADGNYRLQISLTAGNRDHWLKLEDTAKTLISKRLSADIQISKKYTTK